jgi:ankyrin repeat protein
MKNNNLKKRMQIFQMLFIVVLGLGCQKDETNDSKNQQNEITSNAKELEELLNAAIEEKNYDAIAVLLDKGADPNFIIKDRAPLIIWAAGEQSEKLVRLLVDKSADLNIKSPDGYLLFDIALKYFTDDFIKYLIERNIDLLYTSEYFDDVAGSLISAILSGRVQIISLLLDNKDVWQTIENKDIVGLTLVRYWRDGYDAIFRLLERKGYKIESWPLLLKNAIIECQYDAVKWLLGNGVSPLEQGGGFFDEMTSLELASYNIKRLTYQYTDDPASDPEKIMKAKDIKLLLEKYLSPVTGR